MKKILIVASLALSIFGGSSNLAIAAESQGAAQTECDIRMRPYAQYALGGAVNALPTAAYQYGARDWAVRIRYMRADYSYPRTAQWYNCRIIGDDYYGRVGNVSYFLGWAAPNAVLYVDTIPYWTTRLFPFVDPTTGVAW